MMNINKLPVAVIGAGPVGLAAAANLIERDIEPLIFEAGARVAASIWDWGHVRLFTPWTYLIDPACRRLLEARSSWHEPTATEVPYGKDLVEQYLQPIADLDAFASRIHLNHKVVAVSREGHDRMLDHDRDDAPFLLVVETPSGQRRFAARAVIDASGTWMTPNPLGAAGVEADGEHNHQRQLRYGMPDVLDRERDRYAGKRILVVGSGHSAIGAVLNLVELAREAQGTHIAWAIRRSDPSKLWGGGSTDDLVERGALGARAFKAVLTGEVNLLPGLSVSAIQGSSEGLKVVDVDGAGVVIVDEIVIAVGSRPDLAMLRELRLEFDLATESTRILGPLIDPNHHSCGSVVAHGAAELKHPETDFYIVGMKSYGRAPTFLLITGYEQVRSVVAELAGDYEAAAQVELVLPETGVCSTELPIKDGQSKAAGVCC